MRLAAQDRHGVVADLVLGAVVDDRRGDDAEALHVRGARHAGLGQLLDVHERLDRAGVAAARAPAASPARAIPRRTSCGSSAGPRPGRGRWRPTGRRPSPRASGGWRRATRAARRGRPRRESSKRSLMPPAPADRARSARWAAAVPNRKSPVLARFSRKWRSCSHVKPMPPCSWSPSPTTRRWQSPARGLGHRGGDGAAVVVLGDGERREVGERGWPARRRGTCRPAGA